MPLPVHEAAAALHDPHRRARTRHDRVLDLIDILAEELRRDARLHIADFILAHERPHLAMRHVYEFILRRILEHFPELIGECLHVPVAINRIDDERRLRVCHHHVHIMASRTAAVCLHLAREHLGAYHAVRALMIEMAHYMYALQDIFPVIVRIYERQMMKVERRMMA